MIFEERPVVFFKSKSNSVVIGDPRTGIVEITQEKLLSEYTEKIQFVLPRRDEATPTSRFGWSWFTPLLKKYKKSLILVLIASLLAQLFALAIPLLLQQIIDKVLTQGNLSSLNVLGTAMIVMALFQGILQALRTHFRRYN